MESRDQSINELAVGSFACGLLSPLVFTVFVIIGGYEIFMSSYRYQALARVLMVILSVAAVLMGYGAKFQIATSNGFYRGMTMASFGRIVGYLWGAVMLVAILLWGF